jgi:hypothetical protein
VALENLDEIVAGWAARTPSVSGLTLFGSRARSAPSARPDARSDWDFQIISSDPAMFADRTWAESLPGAKLLVYAPRMTRFGKVPKVNAIFEGAEADFVILPARTLWAAKLLVSLGFHRREGFLRRGLRDLAIVIRPGWRFLKGSERWDAFYRRVVAEVDDARMGDAEAVNLADTFVCDYIWTVRKAERGELIAAQRMLHRELAETNLRLLHELRLRRGERSYPEGRRIEQLAAGPGMPAVAPNARCDGPDLRAAAAGAAAVLRELMNSLVGAAWRWPGSLE